MTIVSPIPRTTAVGRRATLIGFGLLLAGFNTGNNLFHLLFTVLAAAEVVGFVVARRTLRRASVSVRAPRRGEVGSPLPLRIEVRNGSRRGVLPAIEWTVRADGADEALITTPPVAPGERASAAGSIVPKRRGRFSVASLEARSDFPLGLAAALVRVPEPGGNALVRPRPLDGSADSVKTQSVEGTETDAPAGRGEEPVEPRRYRPGDDARLIDWKATARSGRIIARSRRGTPPGRVEIRLDRSGGPGAPFEARVSRAAGAAIDALARGAAVGLVTDGAAVPPGCGEAHGARILDLLALVEPAGADREAAG